MTGFEASDGWLFQNGLSCFCHIFTISIHYKYDFIPLTSRQLVSTWKLRTGHITLSAVPSKTKHSILYDQHTYLPICQPTHPPTYQYTTLPTNIPTYIPPYPLTYLPFYLTHPPIYLYTTLLTHLPPYLPILTQVYLFSDPADDQDC